MGEMMNYEKKQKMMVVVSMSCLNVCWGLMCAMQAPFFPKEAALKGATATQFGGVFGIIHLAIVLASPVMGKLVTRLGVANIFKFGALLTSASTFGFGFLAYVNNKVIFLTLAYALRFLEGLGGAALWTSMLALLLKW